MNLNKITKTNNRSTSKISSRLRTDSILAIIVIATPLFFYLYLCFPDVKIWKTFLFNFDSNYYQSIRTFVWVFMQKFIFLYLLIIFYFTCKEWWRDAILSPVAMLLYQIIMLVNDEVEVIDQARFGIAMSIVLVIVICGMLLFLRKKLSTYSQALDLKTQIDLEIKKIEKELDA